MSAFPETPATLLVKLAAQVTGEDEANWVRFADLYVPAIREFARHRGDGRDVDDVVQEVLVGLVRIFRGNKFSVREGKGNFRAYLAKMIAASSTWRIAAKRRAGSDSMFRSMTRSRASLRTA